jgi:hypothetical protein
LDFLLIGKSGKGGNCPNPRKFVTASQFIKIVGGQVTASDFRASVNLTDEAARHNLHAGMSPDNVCTAICDMIAAKGDTGLHPRYVYSMWNIYLNDYLYQGVSYADIQKYITRSMELVGRENSPDHQSLNRDVINRFRAVRK